MERCGVSSICVYNNQDLKRNLINLMYSNLEDIKTTKNQRPTSITVWNSTEIPPPFISRELGSEMMFSPKPNPSKHSGPQMYEDEFFDILLHRIKESNVGNIIVKTSKIDSLEEIKDANPPNIVKSLFDCTLYTAVAYPLLGGSTNHYYRMICNNLLYNESICASCLTKFDLAKHVPEDYYNRTLLRDLKWYMVKTQSEKLKETHEWNILICSNCFDNGAHCIRPLDVYAPGRPSFFLAQTLNSGKFLEKKK